jgi:heme-degrading monooxygenase HmoA
MIARLWRGVADTAAGAAAYEHHLSSKVLPSLEAIAGYGGARVLKRTSDRGEIEFLVMTLWDSMEAIRKFAGDQPESAVVEPEAREALSDYDDFVRHYEVQEP